MKQVLLYSRIAFRNVRRNARRSFLTVTAIAFGLLCLIVFQALKAGLHGEMVASTVHLDAGILQIHAAGYESNLTSLKPIPRAERVREALESRGIARFSPRIKAAGLLLADNRSSTVLLSGVDPNREKTVTFLSTRILKGSYLSVENGILIGREMAQSIGADVGSTITLMAQGPSGLPAVGSFEVAGIYGTELATFDRSHVFLRLEDARRFLSANDVTTEIAVAGEQDPGFLKEDLETVLPRREYQVRTWEEIAPDVMQLIELNDATMGLLILIVFAIIAMSVANTMTMVVFERFRELGILSAIGTPPAGILGMIMLESFFLGVLASLTGSLAALAACSYLARYGVDLTSLTSTNQYFATSHILKARLLPFDFAAANAITLFTAVFGGLYPAGKAARLRPVDAMTHT